MNFLPLAEVHLHDLPIHPAPDVCRVECGNRSQAAQIHRNVLLLNRGHGDRYGSRARSGLGLLRLRIRAAAAADEKRANCRQTANRRRTYTAAPAAPDEISMAHISISPSSFAWPELGRNPSIRRMQY